MNTLHLSFCVSLVLSASPAVAQVTRVVDDDGQGTAANCDDSSPAFTTLGAAIAAAGFGDTVLVCPGTYVENITFGGKAIAVRSIGGPAVTILDGNAAASVVTFAAGESATSVLEGFTIRNGRSAFTPPAYGDGGGIRIDNASPVIRGNVIVSNRACGGGGISIDFGSPVIEENTIANNSQAGCTGGPGGGGIAVRGSSTAVIRRNNINNNTMTGAPGGGISLFAAGSPTIELNVISGNSASEGGGMWIVNQSDASITGNLIVRNRAAKGGGVYWVIPAEVRGLLLVNNTIAANDSPSGSGVFADALDAGIALFNNNIVAAAGQSAVFCGHFDTSSLLVFRSNNVFSATGANYAGTCGDQTGLNANISADPLFVNAAADDYHLLPASPCIDAGYNRAPALMVTDLDGDPRVLDGDADGRAVVDMGADEAVQAITIALPAMSVDTPPANSHVHQVFTIAGWAIDRGAATGPGVDAVHVWAYPRSWAGGPIFVGAAAYGGARPDVGAVYGSQFTTSGFGLTAVLTTAGLYEVVAYAHSTVTGTFNQEQHVWVTVTGDPRMSVDVPGANATVGQSFAVAGWAIDLAAASGPGVDAIHVYAYPASGPAQFVGATYVGTDRWDVAAAFGSSQFRYSGFGLTGTLSPGTYQLVVFARGTVTGTFNQAQAVTITVQ